MIFNFNNSDDVDFTVQSITETAKLGGGEVNMGGNVINNEEVPVMRHAMAKDGSFMVEPNDGSDYTKTLSELLALHSGPGEGDLVVTIDSVKYAEKALVTVSMVGDLGQYVLISFKGSDWEA